MTPIRSPRTRLIALMTFAVGILMAGCGGSSASPASSAARGASTPDRGTPADAGTSALAFARCMRANGVPNFPDPTPGPGFVFNAAGINPEAPAVKTAHAKCQKFVPSGGPARPGSSTHPSAETLARLRKISQCMRQHGVSEFPDPRSSVPLHPFGGGQGVITDYDGAILMFPATLDMHSPAYTQAAVACGTLAQKLGNGPH